MGQNSADVIKVADWTSAGDGRGQTEHPASLPLPVWNEIWTGKLSIVSRREAGLEIIHRHSVGLEANVVRRCSPEAVHRRGPGGYHTPTAAEASSCPWQTSWFRAVGSASAGSAMSVGSCRRIGKKRFDEREDQRVNVLHVCVPRMIEPRQPLDSPSSLSVWQHAGSG